MLSWSDRLSDFVMLDRVGAGEVVALMRDKHIRPRDFGVLLALAANFNHHDNSIPCGSSEIAEQLGWNRADAVASLSRLRREAILGRFQHQRNREARYIFNPYFVTAGGPTRRANHWRRFSENLE
jgi:hypothetical protein